MSAQHDLEDFMGDVFPPDTPYFDLEPGIGALAGELVCECGAIDWVGSTFQGERLTCLTCAQSYLVGTRIHLLPLER
jgi:hypothetical protein